MTDDQLNLYLKQGMEKNMKALDLADKYADAVAAYRLESLYGISESCALEKLEAREKAFEALATELGRLAAELEDAKQAAKTWENEAERRSDRYTKCAAELERIKELEPVAWVDQNYMDILEGPGTDWIAAWNREVGENPVALYALWSKK